jgi:HD superfamily phosphohydrolase
LASFHVKESRFAGGLAAQVQEWAASALRPYFERHPKSPYIESKQIHDPVSGTVYLKPWELYVLDSPIMQRLRYIRQLGVGQVLFPTSAYSRFDHSVGALQAATRMFDAVTEAQREAERPTYREDEFLWRRHVVRLAALLHDIGHCVFSHVSERHYERFLPLAEAQGFYGRFYDTKVTASETLSLLILQSDAFLDLIERSMASRFIQRDDEDILYRVRACIAGSKGRLEPDAFMAEIINGPVDCDKLDYLARDAHTAGVPIALDTNRLISKIRLSEVRSDETGQVFHALTVVLSGTRALDELLVSRLFLFDKFYYHQKLMAAEEVVRRALRLLATKVPEFASPVTLLDYGDDALLHLRAEDVQARYGVDADTAEVVRATDLLRRVRNRDLPKRAFAFGIRFIPRRRPLIARFEDPDATEDAATEDEVVFRSFGRGLEDPTLLDRFTEEVRHRAKELGVTSDLFVAHQAAKRVGKVTHLPVVLPGGAIDKRPPFLFKAHEWTEAYALNRATSYVFGYDDLPKMHLAAERALTEDRGLGSFGPNSWLVAKLPVADIDQERARLPADWIDLRLRPDFLETPEAAEKIEVLREKFASFLNAFDPEIGPQLVETWLAQFPTGDLQDSAIRLLEHTTYVEPSDIVDSFSRLVEARSDLRSALWIPLISQTEPGKSADQLIVDLRDLEVVKAKIGELSATRILEARAVVFFDDSLNTATQALSLLRSWFGADAEEDDAESDRDPYPLPPDVQDALGRVEVTFAFYATHPGGIAHLQDGCRALGLGGGNVDVRGGQDLRDSRFTLEGLQCHSVASKAVLLDFMRKKGTVLLAPRVDTKQWPADRPERFALGFAGLQLTMVFRHSISTGNPAVFWESKRGPNEFWIPLFPRKRKELRTALRSRSKQTPVGELPEYLGS